MWRLDWWRFQEGIDAQTSIQMKVFKLTIKLTFLFLAILTCHSCDEKSTKPTDFDAISETLSNHKVTIIFVGTSWCAATQHTIKEQVIPYLSNPEEGIGFVLIYFGTLNDIPEHLLENTTLIEMESLGGMDKMIANRKLNKVLNDYKRVNYVPFSILTDQQGNILNYDSNKKRYSGISEIKWQIENASPRQDAKRE